MGLAAIVQTVLRQSPFSGKIFALMLCVSLYEAFLVKLLVATPFLL